LISEIGKYKIKKDLKIFTKKLQNGLTKFLESWYIVIIDKGEYR
jgi:hypothetical protein